MSSDDYKYYKSIFYSGGITGFLTKFIHKALEKNVKSKYSKILEIGGGEGYHLPFVTCSYDKYFLTDISLRPLSDYARTIQLSGKLVHEFADGTKLTYRKNQFDRVIFMCVLHHVSDIESLMREARRVCKNGGLISVYLPTDPGVTYSLMRRIVTWRKSCRLKIDYEYINSLGHRNHFYSIFNILKKEFQGDFVSIRRRPFPIPFYNLNLYYIIHITIKK
jgi:phosphatidylethanolamine/phosphatidyl-N-methylethanolamine N-methyltransferase